MIPFVSPAGSSAACSAMRVLAVTNMYPTCHRPAAGVFVEQQISSLRAIGMAVEVLFADRASLGPKAYWGLARQVLASVRWFQPDVVHVMYGGVMAEIVTSAVERQPVVVSFCGSDLLGSSLAGLVSRATARYGVLASHRAARRACGIVVKSKNLRYALPRCVDPSTVRIIPNGINLDRFRPLDRQACRGRLGWDGACFHVLFTSNAGDPCKRPHLAFAAVHALNALGVPSELHELSGVPHCDVPVWLNASDVLLMTSLTEGSPNIVKEALACDLPVVSVDVGDVREQIEDIDGCHIARADPGDLSAALRRVRLGPGRVAARAKIQELSLERVAVRVRDFYREIVGKRARSACGQSAR